MLVIPAGEKVKPEVEGYSIRAYGDTPEKKVHMLEMLDNTSYHWSKPENVYRSRLSPLNQGWSGSSEICEKG